MADILASDILQIDGGWLFLRKGTNDLEGQHTGRILLKDQELRVLRHILTVRAERARMRGMHYLHVVVPNKETIYSDLLAETMPLSPYRIVSQLRELGLPWVVILEEALIAARTTNPQLLYNRNNSYWNDRGAAVAYSVICNDLARHDPLFEPIIAVDSLEFQDANRTEGMEKYLGLSLEYFESRAINMPLTSKLYFTNNAVNRGRIEIWKNERGRGCAAVFADSFTFNVLKRFLREQFAGLHLIHSAVVDFTYIDECKADIVLSIAIERFLPIVPNDWSAPYAKELAETLGKT